MSTLVDTERYSIDAPHPAFAGRGRPSSLDSEIGATVFAEAMPFPLPQPAPETFLQMDFPDFNFRLEAPIIDFQSASKDGKVTARVAIDADVSLRLSLTGKLIEDGSKFRMEQVFISIELADQKARAEFIASTLWAMLSLDEKASLQIPQIRLDVNSHFELPLLEISNLLRNRQTAYRLMVIERATSVKFRLPNNYSGSEIEAISYIFHAIVDRSFVWPIDTVTVYVPATQEHLAKLPFDDGPTRQMLGPIPGMKNILGHSISLGNEELLIEDMIIGNADRVRGELACNDGHQVEMVIRSLSGQAIVKLPEAPQLPDEPWDPKTQALIDLESKLDACLVERYNALAAATLADLTEEEKAEVTARPELDFEAFLMDDTDGEND
ncbi:MAG: hypothetical protein L0229_28370 [Blastocatellia bacterium]|nr:hypothetical protein [Blastocatellia bacterium]